MSPPNTGVKTSTPVDEGSGNGEGDSGADKGTKTPAQVLSAILGDDPKFADEFFGEVRFEKAGGPVKGRKDPRSCSFQTKNSSSLAT